MKKRTNRKVKEKNVVLNDVFDFSLSIGYFQFKGASFATILKNS